MSDYTLKFYNSEQDCDNDRPADILHTDSWGKACVEAVEGVGNFRAVTITEVTEDGQTIITKMLGEGYR